MFRDVINKQAFEITCKTEITARRIQQNIEAHTANQFSNIMEAVFSEAGIKNTFLQIDKIEIDLGDIWVDELGNIETASRFKKILQQKIEDIQNNRKDHGYTLTDRKGTNNATAEIRSELELIRVFITTGDLPWWINKSNSINIDSIVRKLLQQDPEMLKKVLADNWDKPGLLSRLYDQIGPVSISKIAEWIPGFSKEAERAPGFSEAVLTERLIEESVQMKVKSLSKDHLKKLRKIWREHGQKSIESRRYQLAELLVKLYNYLFVNKLTIEGSALGDLLIQSGITWPEKDTRFTTRKKEMETAINATSQLSIFELELLVFDLSTCFDASDNFIFPNAQSIEPVSQVLRLDEKESNPLNDRADIEKKRVNENTFVNKTEENSFSAENTIKPKSSIILPKPELPTGPVEPANTGASKIEIPVNNSHEANPSDEMVDLKNELTTGVSDDAGLDEPFETKIAGLLPQFSKSIGFILKKLKRQDKALLQYLQTLNKTQLQQLATIFRKRSIESYEFKKNDQPVIEPSIFY